MQKRLKLLLLFLIFILFSGLVFYLLISPETTKDESTKVVTEQALPEYSFYCHLDISEINKILTDFHFMKKTGLEEQVSGFFNSFFINSNFDLNYLLNECSEVYIASREFGSKKFDLEKFIAVFRVKEGGDRLSAVKELPQKTVKGNKVHFIDNLWKTCLVTVDEFLIVFFENQASSINSGSIVKSLVAYAGPGSNFLSYYPGLPVLSSFDAKLKNDQGNLNIDFEISFNDDVKQSLWWALCNQSQESLSVMKFYSHDAVLSVVSKINNNWSISSLVNDIDENSQLYSVFGLSPDLIHELWFGGEVLLFITDFDPEIDQYPRLSVVFKVRNKLVVKKMLQKMEEVLAESWFIYFKDASILNHGVRYAPIRFLKGCNFTYTIYEDFLCLSYSLTAMEETLRNAARPMQDYPKFQEDTVVRLNYINLESFNAHFNRLFGKTSQPPGRSPFSFAEIKMKGKERSIKGDLNFVRR